MPYAYCAASASLQARGRAMSGNDDFEQLIASFGNVLALTVIA
jgi:hypothetical protein